MHGGAAMTYFTFPKITYEKHVIEIEKKMDILVKSDVYLDWDVDVNVKKDYKVDVDIDLKIEGNVATAEWDIETFKFVDTFQVVTIAEEGQSSLTQLIASGSNFEYGGVSQATGSYFPYKPADTFTEISFVALVDEYAGSNFSGSSIAAVEPFSYF
jgi:hypothetical protein